MLSFGALALRDASSGELLLRSSGDFDRLQAYELPLTSPLSSSLAPAGTMRAIATSRASLSSRQQRTPLQDAFFKNLSPSSYVGLPLQNGKGVLFLSSGSDVLLDLASSEDSQSIEVVSALTGSAKISIDSSVARRNLSTTVAERTAALKQALEAERSFLSVVSHELRTPLFSILGLVTVLETSDNLSALEVGQLAQVKSSGEDLARLINQVGTVHSRPSTTVAPPVAD
jgi:signal transduction histidine kinase